MISGKELTIEDILREMNNLKNQILLLVEKKKLNVALRYLKAVSLKDVVVSSSHYNNNSMLNTLIKSESLSDSITSKLISYNEYKERLLIEIEKKAKVSTKEEMIVFYRDELHFRWEEIAKIVHYSERQCRRIYKSQKSNSKT